MTTSQPLAPFTEQPAANDVLSRRSGWVLLGATSFSAVLLYLCYFPMAWGFLGWIALVPFLLLVRSDARPRALYLCAWWGGIAFYVPILQWLRVADPRMYFTWIGLSLYCSLYWPLALWLVRRLEHTTRLPLLVTVPLVWIPLEYLRAHFGGGFAWYMLGYTQHAFLPLIQVADLAGAYAVSLLVAMVNVIALEWLSRLRGIRQVVRISPESRLPGRPALVAQSALVLALFTAYFAYGSWRLDQVPDEPGPRVALIQGNVPQQIRNGVGSTSDEPHKSPAQVMRDHYAELGDLASQFYPHADLLVWPETSWPDDWEEVGGYTVDQVRGSHQFTTMVRQKRWGSHVLMGMNARVWPNETDMGQRYNSAVLVGPTGQYLGRYDKMHRVPFGEYVPFRESLPWMNHLAPYDFDYSVSPGEQFTRLPLGKYTFGVIICYEATDPQLAREYVNPAQGAPVDFLINISNDGWFDGTSEHEEHLAVSRFRAIEARRSLTRSVNMGISALIDSNGRVLAPQRISRQGDVTIWEVDPALGAVAELPLARWHEFKKVRGVMLAVVPLDTRTSLYARCGDWLPGGGGILLGVALVFGGIRTRWQARKAAPRAV